MVPCEQQSSTLQTMHFPLGLPSQLSGTSHKKVFWMKTSTYRDGTLKTQPNKMGTTQHFHTIPTSCAILPSMHTTKLSTCSMHTTKLSTCTLAYSNPLNKWTSHSLLLTQQPSCIQDICMFSSNTISLYNIHCNMPYTHSTACALHSFCIQDWPYLPCSVAIVLQQSTTQLTLHAHQHALHINEQYPSQCLPPPSYMRTNQHQAKWYKM